MHLDSDFADPKLMRNLLVQQTCRDQAEYLLFTGGQCFETSTSEQVRCRVREPNQSLVIGRVNVYVVQIELRPKQVGLAARLASD